MEFTFDAIEYTLENGLQVVTINRPTQIASIHIGVKLGAIIEEKDEKGICHFIEHMLFKGTTKRDNISINKDLEERAGSYNAYTDYNSIVLSITSLCEEVENSIEILSDMIRNSVFPHEEIEKEKGVILAEIRTCVDDIEDYSFNRVNHLAFRKSPLKYDVLGDSKIVEKFTKTQLYDFYKRNFVPSNCVITIVSPFEHEAMKETIMKYFSSWTKGEVSKKDIIIENNNPVEKVSYKGNIEQSTITYLYTFHGLNRMEEIALDILSHKLGESPNSILFRHLREDRGIVYDVYSQIDTTEFIKTMYIYTATSWDKIYDAKKVIDDCINKIKTKKISIDERDIELMKKVIRTSLAMILEDSEGLGNYILNLKLMNKKIDSFKDDLKKLELIKVDDIYKVAQNVLNKPTVHILKNK